MQIAIQPDYGQRPLYLSVVKWAPILTGRHTETGTRVKVDMRKVTKVIGKLAEVALVRTAPAALAVCRWLATHGIEAGVVFDRIQQIYGIVVSDDDLLIALALLDGLMVNVMTGAISSKPNDPPRPLPAWRKRVLGIFH